MTLYLQDGAATSHAAWCDEALTNGVADGVIISPFFTPQTHRKGQPSGLELAERVRNCGGEVIFDATTHGTVLPGVNNWTKYNSWDLWSGPRGSLASGTEVAEHVERVFAHQDALRAPHLAPTIAIDNAAGAEAALALELADAGARLDPSAWQSIAGRRGFWLSADLDAHVGALAQLEAPVWMITVIRENGDYPPDVSDLAQISAMCRTVHSLSERSRVVLCHADLFGLPAVAAGADTLGTGWHTKQRVCAPSTFQENDPDSVRRQALWVTYRDLMARLHSVESEILVTRAARDAQRLFRGSVANTARAARVHHLWVLRDWIAAIDGATSRADRVSRLRDGYDVATRELDGFARRFGTAFSRQRAAFIDGPLSGLEDYAVSEGLWTP